MCDKEKSIQSESEPIRVTDAMGREMFWLDAGRPD
jgi:hypothetical protein